jgi:hypothetical protein
MLRNYKAFRKLTSPKFTLDEKLFFLLFEGLVGARGGALGTEQIQAHLNSLNERGSFLHGAPEIVTEFRAGFFDGFEGAGENAVGVQELAAETVGGVGHDAIDFLRLAAGEINDVGGVGNHGGDFRLRIFEQNLSARDDGADARVHVGDETVDVVGGAAQLEKQSGEDHHLDDQRDRRNDAEECNPELHTRPGRPP